MFLLTSGYLLAASAFFSVTGCSLIAQRISAEPVPYSYYAQITIGSPVAAGRRVLVPVSLMDAQINSALAPYRIRTRIAGHEIYMTVVEALAGSGSLQKCQLDLSGVPPGNYALSYRDPDGTRHKLGQIKVP
jgi:hypothetical protein